MACRYFGVILWLFDLLSFLACADKKVIQTAETPQAEVNNSNDPMRFGGEFRYTWDCLVQIAMVQWCIAMPKVLRYPRFDLSSRVVCLWWGSTLCRYVWIEGQSHRCNLIFLDVQVVNVYLRSHGPSLILNVVSIGPTHLPSRSESNLCRISFDGYHARVSFDEEVPLESEL